jgi:hypothetical protein
MRYAFILANLRREGPMPAYIAITDYEFALSKVLLSILQTEYETPLEKTGSQVGRERGRL